MLNRTIGFSVVAVILFCAAAAAPDACFATDRPREHYDRATTFIKKGEYGRAMAELNRAIDIQPNNAQFRFTRGDLYAGMNRPDLAIADYTNIINNYPENGRAYYNRANLYYSVKDYEKCWADVYRAQELGMSFDPKFIEKLKNASGRENSE